MYKIHFGKYGCYMMGNRKYIMNCGVQYDFLTSGTCCQLYKHNLNQNFYNAEWFLLYYKQIKLKGLLHLQLAFLPSSLDIITNKNLMAAYVMP